LFEALTLIQTGKLKNFPVVLYGCEYWQGLIDWMRGPMSAAGNISPGDIDLMIRTDSVEEVVQIILDAHRAEAQTPADPGS
jgi:predicted Rossmann-fold nucleotide-binding protein